ncbi:hypothetical protein JX266_012085 [Neoarthrinium moseri]|nr:hypothetical protein JX266_012085 [Neoarthrinium moseri]
MSIVPTSGYTRKLYNDAQYADGEYHATAFWQRVFQETFHEDWYTTFCEQPPVPGSRLRNDVQVRKYDAHHDTITTIMVGEGKKHKGSLRGAEEQVEESSKVAIVAYGLHGIYSFTFRSTAFRVWYMGLDHRLEPVHGTNARGDKHQYIDADSDSAVEFTTAVALIKDNIPLRVAPVLLSQSSHDGTTGEAEWDDTMMDEAGDAQYYHGGSAAGPSGYAETDETTAGPSGYAETNETTAGPSGYAETYETTAGPSGYGETGETTAGPSGYGETGEATASSSVNIVLHKVYLEKHKRGKETLNVFKDRKGHTISSHRSEWEQVDYGWILYHKGRKFYSEKKPY